MKAKTLLAAVFLMVSAACYGQKWGISTNLLGYANFLTVNAEVSYALHKNWNISLSGKYNPFIFNMNNPDRQMQNKNATLAFGTRYWPFFVNSGFYYGGKLQWTRYNCGGIISRRTFEGDAYGIGFSFGYSLLLTKYLNMEFGIGLWAGATDYREYAIPRCGKLTASGVRWFIAPNDVSVSLMFNF